MNQKISIDLESFLVFSNSIFDLIEKLYSFGGSESLDEVRNHSLRVNVRDIYHFSLVSLDGLKDKPCRLHKSHNGVFMLLEFVWATSIAKEGSVSFLLHCINHDKLPIGNRSWEIHDHLKNLNILSLVKHITTLKDVIHFFAESWV